MTTGLWTLPAPWTRRRAHRALQNARTRFAQRPQAITRGHFYFALTDPHARLDYLFVPAEHLGGVRACDVFTDPATSDASDHFPLAAEIEV